MAKSIDTQVKIAGRLSYPNIWDPKSVQGGEPKYSASIIIPKSDKKSIDKITRAVEAAKEEGKAIWGGKIPNGIKLPIRDGDADRGEDEAYQKSVYFNALNSNKPQVVKRVGNSIVNVEDHAEVYAGCYCIFSVNFYPFNKGVNRGVAVSLGPILKYKDGEPLSGGISAAAAFGGDGLDEFADLFAEDEELPDFLQ